MQLRHRSWPPPAPIRVGYLLMPAALAFRYFHDQNVHFSNERIEKELQVIEPQAVARS
jgi:hypothetical protein